MKRFSYRLLVLFILCSLFVVACAGSADTTVEQTQETTTDADNGSNEESAPSAANDAPKVVDVTRVVTEVVVETIETEAEMVIEFEESAEESMADEAAAAPVPPPSSAAPQVPAVVQAVEMMSTSEATDPDGFPLSSGNEEMDEAEMMPPEMFFQNYGVNPFITSAEDNLSTFAIDVDTAAYTVMRRHLNDGFLPPRDSVRVEEFINFFDQEYPAPKDEAFAIYLEGAPSPYDDGDDYHLVRVGIQGYEVAPEDRPDALLIFVIDVSGSMDQSNRLNLVKESLALLVEQLRPTDRVGIVTYGSEARVILNPTEIAQSGSILTAIDSLQTEGSTNVADGIRVAYMMAERFAEPDGINRLILASDGVANVGATTTESILSYARQNISLSSFGFGMGNYNDVLMEQLANQGDGTYAYIDSIEEAERIFVDDLTSTLLTIAKDAKIQVEFNPAVVERYRLIGYENRDVADADFRNDAVDAGEIGAGHSVTALYEIKVAKGANPAEVALTVRVRYADPDSAEVEEIGRSLGLNGFVDNFEDAHPRFQLDAVVAEYAELLRHSYWAKDNNLDDIVADALQLKDYFPEDEDVTEFVNLVLLAAGLSS